MAQKNKKDKRERKPLCLPYESIVTDDPDTWGMCYSKEAAQECEKQYWERHTKKIIRHIILTFCVVVCSVGLLIGMSVWGNKCQPKGGDSICRTTSGTPQTCT